MKLTVYKCDICGNFIDGRRYQLMAYSVDEEDTQDALNATDLCPTCYERLLKALKAPTPAETEKAEPKSGGRPRVNVDVEKVKMLRARGWTVEAIAEKMNVGKSTIYRALAGNTPKEEENEDETQE